MDQYAVFGHPIGHSKSPLIHQDFAQQLNQALQYSAIEAPLDGFAASAQQFFASGGKGANVTLPFKLQAAQLANLLTPRAQQAAAVNTLKPTAQGLLGDNTDGAGLAMDLARLLGNLSGHKVLLLGAGGAAQGVVGSLLEAGVEHIHIANRTVLKAEQLVKQFSALGAVSAGSLDAIPDKDFSILLNSTACSLDGNVPSLPEAPLQSIRLAYDMFYSTEITAFNAYIQSLVPNAIVSDGLGMLVAQAAESFYLWRGVMPDWQQTLVRIQGLL